MVIKFINREMLCKKWKEIYGENFYKEYTSLFDSINNEEIIIEDNGVIIFKGTPRLLGKFIIDAKQIADYILLDINSGNISEDETPNIDVETYKEFGKNYGTEQEFDLTEIPDGCIKFQDWICDIHFEKYLNNNRTAIELYCHFSGEPVATATVNIPQISLEKDEVIIKDYSENEGMFKTLFTNKIVELKEIIPWHFGVDLFVCKLLVEPKFD